MHYDGDLVSVHVEMSFKNGRVGGDDPDFPFTFNVALKRALLTLQLEKPLQIDRSSVARHIPSDKAEYSKIVSARNEAKSNIEGGGKVTPESLSVVLSAKSGHSRSSSREDQIKVVQEIPRIIAMPFPLGPQEYAWELTPGHGSYLDGQPWDPVEKPRLAVKHISSGRPVLEPVIKALVSCKLDDISITDLKLKGDGIIDTLKEVAFPKNNIAAAVQHLKLILRDLELTSGGLEDRFSNLFIADMVVVEG
ncbi:hypothetical protein [Novosphingobium sp. ZW T3_23]|uniref:hypothetical protein n=1 Tax=Novosphingobium sp. ZW T3_23 TaxID=3378084 RepID=UPI003854B36A